MTDTSGPNTSGLSPSAALTLSLASRLQARTASLGSRVYKLTWKERAMPSGRSIPALRASQMKPGTKVSTSDSDSIGALEGWPTPTTQANTHCYGKDKTIQLKTYGAARLCDWNDKWPEGTKANLSGWATPKATDGSGGRTTETAGGGNVHLDKQARMAGWPTPMATERNASEETMAKRLAFRHKNGQTSVPMYLNEAAQLAGWPTPTSKEAAGGEYKDPEKALARVLGPHANDLRDFAKIALPSTGSPAETGSGGRLRAGHSRWLMRIPHAWDDCAPTATRSTRRKPKASSKPGLPVNLVDVSDIT